VHELRLDQRLLVTEGHPGGRFVPASASRSEVSILGYHHVQLAMPPGEESRAEAFYSGLLGIARVAKPADLEARGGCWFRGEGIELHLGVEEAFKPARKAHPAILVNGLDALEARLREAGVPTAHDVELARHRRFYAHDPFGNRLEFLERLS
jgi:catechol 2,3-dioxygenase-like lactoylglutathione lyase family enzyme